MVIYNYIVYNEFWEFFTIEKFRIFQEFLFYLYCFFSEAENIEEELDEHQDYCNSKTRKEYQSVESTHYLVQTFILQNDLSN